MVVLMLESIEIDQRKKLVDEWSGIRQLTYTGSKVALMLAKAYAKWPRSVRGDSRIVVERI